jgi:ribonuclease Z
MSDALFQEAYKIDIAARKNLRKSDAEADININVTEMRDGAIAEGEGWRIRAIEVVHWPIPLSLGFLIEGDGKKVFFTGDTAPCDAVRNGAAGVDVLIHEACISRPTRATTVATAIRCMWERWRVRPERVSWF